VRRSLFGVAQTSLQAVVMLSVAVSLLLLMLLWGLRWLLEKPQ
jgi:hypothetical protein